MMKHTMVLRYVSLLLLMLLTGGTVKAQDFKITKFEENLMDLSAARADVKDNNGDPCALLKFSVRDVDFEFEPNMGVVKKEQKVGETWLFVPAGTKRITIRHPQLGILRDYVIPVLIEKKVVYEADILITNEEYLRAKQEQNRLFHLNLGVGFNITSIMGPSVNLGLNIGNHLLELGAVYGLGKVYDISVYEPATAKFWGLYEYNAIRLYGRYGFDCHASEKFIITPQAGVALNMYNSSEVIRGVEGSLGKTNSISGTVGCRLSFCIIKSIRLQVTPEFDFGIKEDKGVTVLKEADTKIKSWTTGFNLNAGLVFSF